MSQVFEKVSPSRRSVLRWGAAGAAAVGLSRWGFAQTFSGASRDFAPPSEGPNRKVPGEKYALVERITFGYNQVEKQLFDKLGWNGYLEYHLNPAAIPDKLLEKQLQAFAPIHGTPYQCLKEVGYDQGFDVYADLAASQFFRAVYTRRQLQEVMTEFWLDHFNVSVNAVWSEFLPQYVRDIRANALGNFKTLLTTVVKAGAMLFYLDNIINEKGYHNENFARELMELHTLGVDNGYWEADIYVARRCFTGWNFEGFYEWPWDQTTNPNWGQFRFYPERHDDEGGYYLGTTPADYIAKGGVEQGEKIIDKLASHPSTAKHICEKLCVKFLAYQPDSAIVNSATTVFQSTNGDIKAVLRHILSQANFTTYAKSKYKRPFHFMTSALRATEATVSDPWNILWDNLQSVRQAPFQWAPPNGYPDSYDAWVDNLLPRWRFVFNLAGGSMWGARMDPFTRLTTRTADDVVRYINLYYFAGTLGGTRRTQLLNYMGTTRPTNNQIREAIGLALNGPEFAWY